jgi:hypothetical protein
MKSNPESKRKEKSMKEEDQITSSVGTIALFIAAIIVATFMNGWAFSVLWEWFIKSAFEVPSLTIIQSIGVAMTINFLIVYPDNDMKTKNWTDMAGLYIGKAIFYPVITVIIGWLVSGLL